MSRLKKWGIQTAENWGILDRRLQIRFPIPFGDNNGGLKEILTIFFAVPFAWLFYGMLGFYAIPGAGFLVLWISGFTIGILVSFAWFLYSKNVTLKDKLLKGFGVGVAVFWVALLSFLM